MVRLGTAGSLRLASACLAALCLSCALAGCSGVTFEQGQPASETAGEASASKGGSAFAGASDHGMVIDLDSEGVTLRPDEGSEEIAMISLEDTGAERRIGYADGCAFSIIKGDASTGDYTETPATRDAVKKDSMVFVWTDANGLAKKVAVFRDE